MTLRTILFLLIAGLLVAWAADMISLGATVERYKEMTDD